MLALKQLRESKGITQADLSRTLKISPSTVGMWEQGRREPDYKMLSHIADYFNVTADYLLGRKGSGLGYSDEEARMIDEYRGLDAESKSLVRGMIRRLRGASEPKINVNKVDTNYGVVSGEKKGNVNMGSHCE